MIDFAEAGMQLTVREAARILKVSEQVIFSWVREQNLPAEKINDQYRFHRAEILEWATAHKKDFDPVLLQKDNGGPEVSLVKAIQLGGVKGGLSGATKEEILRAVVAALPLPADWDRDFLLQVFLGREALGATDLGNGVAIPHPRYPVLLPGQAPFITVCYLQSPLAYSPGGTAVHTLFALISPTQHLHLQLLARLAQALRDQGFMDLIKRQSPAEVLLQHLGQPMSISAANGEEK